MNGTILIAALCLGCWIYLVGFRGMFWLFRETDAAPPPVRQQSDWPAVIAIVPARNEEDCIGKSLRSIAAQDYAGELSIVVVDDQSTDNTRAIIHGLNLPQATVIPGAARPPGWAGKTWAQKQGIAAAGTCRYYWLTDADIVHSADNLRHLVLRAESKNLALISLMARLSCRTVPERLLIPAFVFFFAMLFPFSWVNNPRTRLAAAAGGCMLVRCDTLEQSGGIDAIRAEIIDDCALARVLKRQGPIWLGLTDRAVSIRTYSSVGDIRAMVARTAFAQLHYSWAMLAVTVFAIGTFYAAPTFLAFFGTGVARYFAILAYACMAVVFAPISRFYRQNPVMGLALPAIALCYAAFTLDSAIQYRNGRGGMWKGRVQAAPDTNQSGVEALSSGKGHRNENFPVASFLIAPPHREIILTFYRFVREADDVSDHPGAAADEKLRVLEQMASTLAGESDRVASGVALRRLVADRGISQQHALDLLEAFRRDVTKLRYRDWADLLDYCSVSAMPVGRFMLDVHGESRALWPLNDALCAALQIINHIQDCGADYRNLNRVYIPQEILAASGARVEDLGEAAASPSLRHAIRSLAQQNQILLDRAAPFAAAIRDRRLSLEVAVIHRLACDLNRRLLDRDPLSDRVHHRKAEALALAIPVLLRRLLPANPSQTKIVIPKEDGRELG